MPRYGMVIDLKRCTGCMTCVIACKEENLTRPNISWNRVLTIESSFPESINHVRYACMHCDDPPCVKACSAKAIQKRPDGIVFIDHAKCEGRGDCVSACPYGVIDINPDEDYFPGQRAPYQDDTEPYRVHPPGKASTCTMCIHRVEQGKVPACVEACPSRVMTFGDLDDPESAIAEKLKNAVGLLPARKTGSKVFYLSNNGLLERIEQKIAKGDVLK